MVERNPVIEFCRFHRSRPSIETGGTWRLSCLTILACAIVSCALAPSTPAASQARHSTFDKLYLTSWLREGGREVIFVQNSETNVVQRVTREPDQGQLRLIVLDPGPGPQFASAIISDGKEKGAVKFRFDLQQPAGQPLPVPIPKQAKRQASSVPNQAAAAVPKMTDGSSNTQTSSPRKSGQANQVIAHPFYPGIPRVHTEGG
jgi:hypothetical protein